MAKKEIGSIKLQVSAGQANPSPPIGPALGQHGVNIMEFCKAFNAKTSGQEGMIIPVVITVYQDRSFSFITKTLQQRFCSRRRLRLPRVLGIRNGKGGKVTRAQVEEIAKTKMVDLNANDLDNACRIIEGTARSMGIEVV